MGSEGLDCGVHDQANHKSEQDVVENALNIQTKGVELKKLRNAIPPDT
jgi:hypothetical protein